MSSKPRGGGGGRPPSYPHAQNKTPPPQHVSSQQQQQKEQEQIGSATKHGSNSAGRSILQMLNNSAVSPARDTSPSASSSVFTGSPVPFTPGAPPFVPGQPHHPLASVQQPQQQPTEALLSILSGGPGLSSMQTGTGQQTGVGVGGVGVGSGGSRPQAQNGRRQFAVGGGGGGGRSVWAASEVQQMLVEPQQSQQSIMLLEAFGEEASSAAAAAAAAAGGGGSWGDGGMVEGLMDDGSGMPLEVLGSGGHGGGRGGQIQILPPQSTGGGSDGTGLEGVDLAALARQLGWGKDKSKLGNEAGQNLQKSAVPSAGVGVSSGGERGISTASAGSSGMNVEAPSFMPRQQQQQQQQQRLQQQQTQVEQPGGASGEGGGPSSSSASASRGAGEHQGGVASESEGTQVVHGGCTYFFPAGGGGEAITVPPSVSGDGSETATKTKATSVAAPSEVGGQNVAQSQNSAAADAQKHGSDQQSVGRKIGGLSANAPSFSPSPQPATAAARSPSPHPHPHQQQASQTGSAGQMQHPMSSSPGPSMVGGHPLPSQHATPRKKARARPGGMPGSGGGGMGGHPIKQALVPEGPLSDVNEYNRRLQGLPLPMSRATPILGGETALRREYQSQKLAIMASHEDAAMSSSSRQQLPSTVQGKYFCLRSLESENSAHTTRFCGYSTFVYKALCVEDSYAYCLRRVDGFRHTNFDLAQNAVELWSRRVRPHPCIVPLRQALTTLDFPDSESSGGSLVCVYDFIPNAQTLQECHLSGHTASPVPESLLWTYCAQLVSALSHIHASGLAARVVEPTKVLVSFRNRIRLNCVGLLDAVKSLQGAQGGRAISDCQQHDLHSLGRLLLALGCGTLQALADIAGTLQSLETVGGGGAGAAEFVPAGGVVGVGRSGQQQQQQSLGGGLGGLTGGVQLSEHFRRLLLLLLDKSEKR
eukprot:Cvel_26353.t1-p1 / transcript=Cvel_26353.t1 / gene=Cvel_26353 / organism=Chromera_velia_CCMP2878 / gene_product=PAB-dependent poly(A)-specific ribonuclease subunit, putative / transcript_product=PAB-dependent poly(A)-specific ribonuclease subunit, putative / location=Cvel_scaffold3121:119-7774(-) / protein_length=929 / sequence_SO=supercontig / SO=protein_coding / is_pseudo=false